MAKTAFISYASEDEPTATKISAYLERNRVSCWIAPRDVRPGADYGSEIIDGIETSAVLVLVLSEHANSSEFVKREVERAVSKGKPVFPVRVREVVPSKSLELFVSSAEWIDAWHPPIEQYLDRLAESIRTFIHGPGAPQPPSAALPALPTTGGRSVNMQRALMVGLGLAVIVLSVLLLRSMLRHSAGPSLSGTTSSAPAGGTQTGGAPPIKDTAAGAARPGVSGADAGAAGPCPGSLSINRELPTPFSCTCSAEAASKSSVWGTDVYTDDSGLCRAALHAGVITPQGGLITVLRGGGRSLYVGSVRNGVASNDFPAFPNSIEFKGTQAPPPGPGLCPASLAVNHELPTPFTCRCTSEVTQRGSVWGTDVYTDDSAMCHAALHAGVIAPEGGVITVLRGGGRPLYVGSNRNGVASNDFANFPSSIEFKGTPPPPPGPGLCPASLSVSRELPTPFTCRCSPEATQRGSVWGTDVYTDDSAMCRAAFHAGRIPLTGGVITAVRAEGRALYVGSTRNGVASSDFGAFQSSVTFR
jgi:TIR domain/LCCL domain